MYWANKQAWGSIFDCLNFPVFLIEVVLSSTFITMFSESLKIRIVTVNSLINKQKLNEQYLTANEPALRSSARGSCRLPASFHSPARLNSRTNARTAKSSKYDAQCRIYLKTRSFLINLGRLKARSFDLFTRDHLLDDCQWTCLS